MGEHTFRALIEHLTDFPTVLLVAVMAAQAALSAVERLLTLPSRLRARRARKEADYWEARLDAAGLGGAS